MVAFSRIVQEFSDYGSARRSAGGGGSVRWPEASRRLVVWELVGITDVCVVEAMWMDAVVDQLFLGRVLTDLVKLTWMPTTQEHFIIHTAHTCV